MRSAGERRLCRQRSDRRRESDALGGVRRAGAGNDRILARDGKPDTIDCGPGRDVAIVDRKEDGVFDCEVVKEP